MAARITWTLSCSMSRYFKIRFRIRTLMLFVMGVCICLAIGIRRSRSIAQYDAISFDLAVWRAVHWSFRDFRPPWDEKVFTEIGDIDSNCFGYQIDPYGEPSIALTVSQPIFPYITMPELRIVELGNPNVVLTLEEFNIITKRYVRIKPFRNHNKTHDNNALIPSRKRPAL